MKPAIKDCEAEVELHYQARCRVLENIIKDKTLDPDKVLRLAQAYSLLVEVHNK